MRELDERKQKILQAIVQDYITSAEPVGSRTVARKYNLGISAATIRNEMFDLEMMGYLEQPHTSAGRTPSAKGYRFYVDCLLQPAKIREDEKRLVQSWFADKLEDVDQIFQSTAKVLAKITHNVTLVVAPRQIGAKLKYIRFVPLDDRRAIMLVVTDSGEVENSIYAKPADVDMDELNLLAEKLTNRLTGMRLDKITAELLDSFRGDIVGDLDLYRTAFRSLHQSFRKQELYRGGTMELLNAPEFRDVDKALSLFGMLEEREKIVDLLNEGRQEGGSSVVVRIGDDRSPVPLNDCSIIEATFRGDDEVLGKIAVLGPTRMEYAKIIGLLEFMKEHVTQILTHYRDDK